MSKVEGPARGRASIAAAIGLALLLATVIQAVLVYQYIRMANTDQPEAALTAEQRPQTPPAATPTARPDRVVLVVLDGLRADTAQQMPALVALGKQGVFTQAQAPIPSLSRPAYTVMVSGAEPGRSGIRTNSWNLQIGVDTVLDRATQAGMTVLGGGNLSFWGENFEAGFKSWETFEPWDDPAVVDAGAKALLTAKADIAVLHLVSMDRVGHKKGGASKDYKDAAAALDARVGALLGTIDLTRDAVIVVSDHGHLDIGGHGGGEPDVRAVPLIMAGRGIKQGAALELGSIAGIAPTIAAMLGLSMPSDLTAEPWWATLDTALYPEPYQQARRDEWTAHRIDYERLWLATVYKDWTSTRLSGEVVGNRVSAATFVPDGSGLDALETARQTTLEEITRDRRIARTPVVALILVPLMILLVVGGLRGFGLWPALVAPIVMPISLGLHIGLGRPFSWSAIATYSGVAINLALAFLAGLAAFVAVQAVLSRRFDPEIRRQAMRFHFTAAALLNAAVAPMVWMLFGFALDAPLPSPALMFLPIFAGYTAGLFTGVAALWWLFDAARLAVAKPKA